MNPLFKTEDDFKFGFRDKRVMIMPLISTSPLHSTAQKNEILLAVQIRVPLSGNIDITSKPSKFALEPIKESNQDEVPKSKFQLAMSKASAQ